jgi:hypothetical protein
MYLFYIVLFLTIVLLQLQKSTSFSLQISEDLIKNKEVSLITLMI